MKETFGKPVKPVLTGPFTLASLFLVRLDLEMSNSELALLDLFKKDPFTKDLLFGVVDVHTHAIEDAVVVQDRLRSALEVLKPEQVWVGPDCGLKTRTVDEAVDKLKVCVDAAKALRGELAKVK